MAIGVIALSLMVPFIESIRVATVKHLLVRRGVSDFAVIFATFAYILPGLAIVLARQGELSGISIELLGIVTTLLVLEIPAQRCYHAAIKEDKLGYVLPIISTKTLLITVISAILFPLGGNPIRALFGVLMVFFGQLSLHVSRSGRPWQEWLLGLREAMQRRSAQLALATAFLWSATTPLQRVGSELSSPHIFGFVFLTGLAFSFLIWGRIVQGSMVSVVLPKQLPLVAVIGLLQGVAYITQYWCLTKINPGYLMALKESLIFWVILWGRVFFGEKVSRHEFISILLITGGAVFIALNSM